MTQIIHKTKNFVIINKPAGVPTQSDTTGDEDAMTMTSRMLSSQGEPSDLWLVHRLDRVVSGLVVFARSKAFAAALSELVGGRGMEKEYLAVVEGRALGGVMRDLLYKDSKKGKAFVVDTERRGAKKAELEYTPLAFIETERGIRTLVRIRLHMGRFIRFGRSLPQEECRSSVTESTEAMTIRRKCPRFLRAVLLLRLKMKKLTLRFCRIYPLIPGHYLRRRVTYDRKTVL